MRYAVVASLAALCVVVGGVGPWAYGTFVDTSAKDRIEADPPPRLFPGAQVAPTARAVAGESMTAQSLMRQWWSSHDRRPHDAAFVTWTERVLPRPPDETRRTAEVRRVQTLARRRTQRGVSAATWLETHGKKDVWKLAVHDQAELLPQAQGERRKQELDQALSMAKDVADTLGARYQESAPYVLHPDLRPDHTVAPGQVCPCSYPSRHAAVGAAARTYLAYLSVHRAADYRWTEAQIDYSRVYMSGHVPSDITAGALLGDMIGEYMLVTREQAPVSSWAPG